MGGDVLGRGARLAGFLVVADLGRPWRFGRARQSFLLDGGPARGVAYPDDRERRLFSRRKGVATIMLSGWEPSARNWSETAGAGCCSPGVLDI